MDKALTVVEGEFVELRREPTEVLDDARRAAKALTTVIDQKPRKVMIKGQVYLEYEDWQTVAQFYGYTVRTCDAIPVDVNGIKGAKAKAELIDFRTGMVVGGAEAYCMSDEENWGAKPWFQLASMSQTRAGAKAIRNRMAWVVVLAGYSGTPAEEMIQEKVSERKEKEAHWCKEHDTAFFMKGKMKSHAHPIKGVDGKDTGEWCHEPSEAIKPEPKESIIEQPEEAPLPTTEPEKAEPRPAKKKTSGLTWDSVRPSLAVLYNGKVQGWAVMDSIIEKLVGLGATETDKIQVAFESLSDEAKAKFNQMVNDAKENINP